MTPITPEQQARMEQRIAISDMARDWLNMTVETPEPLTFRMQYTQDQLGNVIIKSIHGGIISSFIQNSCYLTAYALLPEDTSIHVTSIHVTYLNPSNAEDTFCAVQVKKIGRRMTFLEATIWQQDPSRLIARGAVSIRTLRAGEKATAP